LKLAAHGVGTGRDVYLASKLVGPSGKVIGVDMNPDQLGIAEKFHKEMAEKWGYDNVEFKQVYIEALIGNIEYTSRTIRAFKLPDTVEDICEQCGQTAIYRGGIEGCEKYFDLGAFSCGGRVGATAAQYA
jgi:hypothetical protein